jgi:hypothetical protein
MASYPFVIYSTWACWLGYSRILFTTFRFIVRSQTLISSTLSNNLSWHKVLKNVNFMKCTTFSIKLHISCFKNKFAQRSKPMYPWLLDFIHIDISSGKYLYIVGQKNTDVSEVRPFEGRRIIKQETKKEHMVSRAFLSWFLLVSFLSYNSTLTMEAVKSSETSVSFYRTIRCYIISNIHSYCRVSKTEFRISCYFIPYL